MPSRPKHNSQSDRRLGKRIGIALALSTIGITVVTVWLLAIRAESPSASAIRSTTSEMLPAGGVSSRELPSRKSPHPPDDVQAADRPIAHSSTPADLEIPLGLPMVKAPYDNPLTREKIALGRRLFFDTNLSADRTMSCATCHDPERGWSNGERFATGVDGTVGKRNTPTLFNVAYNRRSFWDGRAKTLEIQALGPILNPHEMAIDSRATLVARVTENEEYHRMFADAFSDGITVDNVANAVACFERTILAGNTPYDRFQAGDPDALSKQAERGMRLFFSGNRSRCAACHPAPLFTDGMFYNLGVGMDKPNPDEGFKAVSGFDESMGKFKTPTLRNIAKTAPYMHDGSMKTLDEVMDFYIKGGHPNPYLDSDVVKLQLNEEEKQAMIAFLVVGLTSPVAVETQSESIAERTQ